MKPGLIVTIGCPGSGKSTWAERNLPPECLRLERDRFRECIFGSRQGYHEHPSPRDIRSNVITHAMRVAMWAWPYNTYAVTDTGLQYHAVQPFIDHASNMNLETRLLVFDRPLDLLLERNQTRPEEHRIPEDILLSCYESFVDENAWWRHPSIRRSYVK